MSYHSKLILKAMFSTFFMLPFFNSSADEIKLDPAFAGYYGKDKYCASETSDYCERRGKNFLFRVRNNVLMVVDNKNKNSFKVDFDNPDEQLQEDYKNYFISRSAGAASGMLDSISISNHSMKSDGKEVDFDVNFNFKFESIFGRFNGTIALHTNGKLSDNCITRYDEGEAVPCVDISSNGIRFTRLDTNLPSSARMSVGLTLDFIFRFFSIFSNPFAYFDLHKKQ